MKHVILYCSAIFLLLAVNASGQKAAILEHRIDSIVEAAIHANLIPGAVVRIQKTSRIAFEKAYGLAQKYDIHHQPLPQPPAANTETLYDLASLTKVVGTTTSLMVLVDQHKIHVDDPVSRYLPGFDTGAKKEITIRHLLTHTAGLYEWYPLFYYSSHRASTVQFIEALPLRYPVGRQRKYSDLGFTLLGAIIEKVSGLPLDKFQQEYIFKPLYMTHTLYNPRKNGVTTNIAATSLGNPYEYRMVHDSTLGFAVPGLHPQSWNGWRQYVVNGEVNDGNAWYAGEGISGAAGLFSTAGDLQHLVSMLMDRGMFGGTRILSEQTIHDFLQPDSFHNGLGWMMDPENSFMKNAPASSFGHTGFTGTSIAVVPQAQLSVIILINRQNMGLQPNGVYYNPNPIRQAIFEAAMDLFYTSKP